MNQAQEESDYNTAVEVTLTDQWFSCIATQGRLNWDLNLSIFLISLMHYSVLFSLSLLS